MTKKFINSRLHTVVMALSLTLNVLFVTGYLVVSYVQSSGELDTAQINAALTIMCSDEYREKHASITPKDDQGKKQIALLDYNCANNGAGTYYEKGYNEYIGTLGLKP